MIPDNRGGFGGTIGIAEATRAAPTVYDMSMAKKDDMAVARAAWTPVLIVTSVNSRFQSLTDGVAVAKPVPDTMNDGSWGDGTLIHLAGEILNTASSCVTSPTRAPTPG